MAQTDPNPSSSLLLALFLTESEIDSPCAKHLRQHHRGLPIQVLVGARSAARTISGCPCSSRRRDSTSGRSRNSWHPHDPVPDAGTQGKRYSRRLPYPARPPRSHVQLIRRHIATPEQRSPFGHALRVLSPYPSSRRRLALIAEIPLLYRHRCTSFNASHTVSAAPSRQRRAMHTRQSTAAAEHS